MLFFDYSDPTRNNELILLQKTIIVDIEKCTGCRICETACSLFHEKECNPAKSRIQVLKWEQEGLDVPSTCQQCDEPICGRICPVKAIFRDEKTGGWLINHDVCIGCRMCLIVCPFGGVSRDMEKGKMLKCDLCEGDPKCVKYCPTGALEYVSATKAALAKKRSSSKRLGELVNKVIASP